MRLPLLLAALFAATPAIAQPVTGRWLTEGGKGIVAIAPCGPALCGKVERILARDAKANQTDSNNPDPKLRSRPIVGINILSGFVADGKQWKGRIYDPESGKSYRSIVERGPGDTLKVKGCIAFLCQTQTWRAAG